MKGKKKVRAKLIQNKKSKSYFVNWIKDNKSILIFLAKFFGLFLIFELLINLADLSILTNLLAMIVGTFFNLPYLGNTIFVDSTQYIVSNSCTGLVSLAILIAITLPLKEMALKKRLGIILIGAFLLLTLNIPRIGLVIYSSLLGFNAEMVHELTWFFMSAVILVIWYYGIKFIEKKKEFSELI